MTENLFPTSLERTYSGAERCPPRILIRIYDWLKLQGPEIGHSRTMAWISLKRECNFNRSIIMQLTARSACSRNSASRGWWTSFWTLTNATIYEIAFRNSAMGTCNYKLWVLVSFRKEEVYILFRWPLCRSRNFLCGDFKSLLCLCQHFIEYSNCVNYVVRVSTNLRYYWLWLRVWWRLCTK